MITKQAVYYKLHTYFFFIIIKGKSQPLVFILCRHENRTLEINPTGATFYNIITDKLYKKCAKSFTAKTQNNINKL